MIDYPTDEYRSSENLNQVKVGLNTEHGLIDFEFSYFGEPPIAQQDIYSQVLSFHTWLASEGKAAVIEACPNQNRQFMFSLMVYQDDDIDSGEMRLTCRMGT